MAGTDITWTADWLAPYREPGESIFSQLQSGRPLPEALNLQLVGQEGFEIGATTGYALARRPASRLPCFVPQNDLPEGTAYEQHIFDTGCVPTRENLHDFFNGLVWLRFPQAKRRLNQLQAAEIERAGGVGPLRGPARDGLTLFDENAAVLQAPDGLWNALVERDWHRLFADLRPLWAQAQLVLFGHALMEKLVVPYKSITAHVYRAPVPLALGHDLAAWDDWLAGQLNAEELATKPFTPLPVLGVPGWWPANADPDFYADDTVFRPPRPAI